MAEVRRRSQRLAQKQRNSTNVKTNPVPLSNITKRVRFNPKVQLFLYPLKSKDEKVRPPVFCRCEEDESSEAPRIACDGCHEWHTLRCLNIPSNAQIKVKKIKSCIRCRKAELWRKILLKIQIGQPLRHKEVFSVSKKLHIQPLGTTADMLVRLVCFLKSRSSEVWAQPPSKFGPAAQIQMIYGLQPEVLSRTLEQANLSTSGRLKDRVLRLHTFLTANLPDRQVVSQSQNAARRPMTPGRRVLKACPAKQTVRRQGKSRPGRTRLSSRIAQTENATPPPRRTNRRNNDCSPRDINTSSNRSPVPLSDRTNVMNTPSRSIVNKKRNSSQKRSPLPPGEKELWDLATDFRSSLEVFTRDELRTECMNCGLRRGGTKAELAQRLALYLAQQEHRVKKAQRESRTHPAQCECENCRAALIQSLQI